MHMTFFLFTLAAIVIIYYIRALALSRSPPRIGNPIACFMMVMHTAFLSFVHIGTATMIVMLSISAQTTDK